MGSKTMPILNIQFFEFSKNKLYDEIFFYKLASSSANTSYYEI